MTLDILMMKDDVAMYPDTQHASGIPKSIVRLKRRIIFSRILVIILVLLLILSLNLDRLVQNYRNTQISDAYFGIGEETVIGQFDYVSGDSSFNSLPDPIVLPSIKIFGEARLNIYLQIECRFRIALKYRQSTNYAFSQNQASIPLAIVVEGDMVYENGSTVSRPAYYISEASDFTYTAEFNFRMSTKGSYFIGLYFRSYFNGTSTVRSLLSFPTVYNESISITYLISISDQRPDYEFDGIFQINLIWAIILASPLHHYYVNKTKKKIEELQYNLKFSLK